MSGGGVCGTSNPPATMSRCPPPPQPRAAIVGQEAPCEAQPRAPEQRLSCRGGSWGSPSFPSPPPPPARGVGGAPPLTHEFLRRRPFPFGEAVGQPVDERRPLGRGVQQRVRHHLQLPHLVTWQDKGDPAQPPAAGWDGAGRTGHAATQPQTSRHAAAALGQRGRTDGRADRLPGPPAPGPALTPWVPRLRGSAGGRSASRLHRAAPAPAAVGKRSRLQRVEVPRARPAGSRPRPGGTCPAALPPLPCPTGRSIRGASTAPAAQEGPGRAPAVGRGGV